MKKTIGFAVSLILLSLLIIVYKIIFQLNGQGTLSSLPFNLQQTVRLLMVIPLGLLIVAIFRNIIGINTFGTFTPVLLALAFMETKLIWGLVLFFFVIITSIFAKWFLDKLKLLFISRISVILTIVITATVILIFFAGKLGFEGISGLTLFPLVIMIMLVERFSIAQLENGTKDALLLSFQTLLVVYAVYWVISYEVVQLFMFFFPELILAIVGLLILVGCYTGLRLTELYRFRDLDNK